MDVLHEAFYEELDGPGGQNGSVSVSHFEFYLTGPDLFLTPWYQHSLNPKQRRAFLMFAIQQASFEAELPNGQNMTKIRYPLLLMVMEECF
jgi:hypothetical protein